MNENANGYISLALPERMDFLEEVSRRNAGEAKGNDEPVGIGHSCRMQEA